MRQMTTAQVEEAMGLNDLMVLTPEQIEAEDNAYYSEMTELLKQPDDITHREKVEQFFGKEYANSIDDEGIEADWNIIMEDEKI